MNLPNKLSLMRICLVPFFVAAYFLPYYWGAYVAVALFIIASATDFLDGYIARKYKMVTDLGKLLDPIADKVLVCAALFCVVATNPLQYLTLVDYSPLVSYRPQSWMLLSDHSWAANFGLLLLVIGAIVIISRELLISAVRQIAASKGVVVQANVFGKIKTIFQDVSLPMLVVCSAENFQAIHHDSSVNFRPTLFWAIWWWASVVLFAVAVILTIVSGIVYLIQNRKVFSN